MHYYKFNIGDYRRDTQHLTILEHGVYRILLDSYYLNEKPLCEDTAELMRTHCIRTPEEEQAAKNVLKDFFVFKKGKGYIHKKCDQQIKQYRAKSDKARASAKKRWDAKGMRTHSEGNANHKPLTTNHKPIEKNGAKSKRFTPPSVNEVNQYCVERGNDVHPQSFIDFYESKNWMIGKNKMKDWKAAVRTWERRDRTNKASYNSSSTDWANDMSEVF